MFGLFCYITQMLSKLCDWLTSNLENIPHRMSKCKDSAKIKGKGILDGRAMSYCLWTHSETHQRNVLDDNSWARSLKFSLRTPTANHYTIDICMGREIAVWIHL